VVLVVLVVLVLLVLDDVVLVLLVVVLPPVLLPPEPPPPPVPTVVLFEMQAGWVLMAGGIGQHAPREPLNLGTQTRPAEQSEFMLLRVLQSCPSP
jgi:hypothetical protein